MLVDDDGTFIHVNADGSRKVYAKVDNVLEWLKRKTKIRKLEIDIGLWKENDITNHP